MNIQNMLWGLNLLSPFSGLDPSLWVKVTVTKPVWSEVEGLRQVLNANDITERRSSYPLGKS